MSKESATASSSVGKPTQRVMLITGASSGIGRTCAISLSNAFPSQSQPEELVLVLSGRREAELKATADACRKGTICEICIGDVSSEEDVGRMFATVKQKYGRLDLLFNNAGMNLLGATPLEEADMTKFRDTLMINVMGSVLCTKEAIKIMSQQEPQGGRIVNNGSISATSPRPNQAAYTCSKYAIAGLSQSTSLDGRKHKITCTQLDIGNAQTALGSHVSKGALQADGSLKVEPMMGVENVGRTLVFLAGLPAEADVLHMSIIAAGMPFVGRG